MYKANRIVEFRVRPVTRYVITRFHGETTPTGGGVVGSESLGEFDNQVRAVLIAKALAGMEEGASFVEDPLISVSVRSGPLR